MKQFSEATRVQMPAMVHLARIGYTYFGKLSEDKNGTVYDGDTNILLPIFKQQFKRLNPELEGEYLQVLKDICKELNDDDLGRGFYNRLKAVSPVRLIDFDNIGNNTRTLPDETSDLAQELTKDPYNFAFTGITQPYNEQILKDALLANISQFLLELGTGFAYVGKEYRLQIGKKEKFIDLLFYNLNLSCYVVIEVKIGEFDFQDLGQLSGYVVACNHILKKEGRDNPTIGLLICRQKDSLLAQYALEGSNLSLGISEYELSKLYPEKVEGTIPTIEEIEAKLRNEDKK